jgi:hyperosmotically inducible protein
MPHPQTNIFHRRDLMGLLALVMLGGHGHVFAITSLDEQSQSPLMSEFLKLDRNSNGKLSNEEASRDSDIVHNFYKADEDHDGTLSADEYFKVKSSAQRARLEAFLDDSSLTAKIKTELFKDIGMKGLSISVETFNGRVILSGFVDTAQQTRRAVEITSGIRGVRSITNSLRLKKPDDQAIRAPKTQNTVGPGPRSSPVGSIIKGSRTYMSMLIREAQMRDHKVLPFA